MLDNLVTVWLLRQAALKRRHSLANISLLDPQTGLKTKGHGSPQGYHKLDIFYIN